MIIDRKDDIMNDSIYYKATYEDGNTVLKHGWKNHKYLYIKNGKYVYPEDVKNTANAARAKENPIKSKAEYKLTKAGEKLTNDVKSSGAYKSAKKGINSISRDANKAYKSAKKGINRIPKNVNNAYESVKSNIPAAAEVRSKANSIKSKADYKLTRADEKLTNDVNSSVAYKPAKKGINNVYRDANKAYKSAKKKAKKVNRTFNKVKRAGKAYIDYLTK